jgi:hypothetical protein
MFSTIEFTIEIGEERYPNLCVQISQPYGTSFEEPFEVGKIIGYDGPWVLNGEQFKQLCERYYRKLVGSTGSAIRIANATMRNNTIYSSKEESIDLRPSGHGGW